MFHVGQNVVCISGAAWFVPGTDEPAHGPSLNQICTIRGFDSSAFDGLLLEGFYGNYYFDGTERGFMQDRFRALVDNKTDISVFTALLNPTPQKVRESIGYDLGFTKEEIGLS